MLESKEKGKKVKVTEVDCKTALSPSRLPGYDYSLNPYRGCAHGCKYCYVPNILRIPRIKWGKFVEVKRNIPKVLAYELKNKEKGVVGISTTTDPYQPLEESYKLTRYCLSQLLKYDYPVSIITKSPLVIRDIDLLLKFSEAEVGFTITTFNDMERRVLEPNSPSIESRIKALKKCSETGISTYVFLGPLYPTIKENELEKLMEEIKNAGSRKIMVDRLNLKPGVWDSVNNALGDDKDKSKIWQEAIFGDKNHYINLFKQLQKICNEKEITLELQKY